MYGILYYLYFQFIGILITAFFFQKERTALRLLFGSVTGSVLYIWLPVLFAFFADFTVLALFLAFIATLPLWVIAFRRRALLFSLAKNDLISLPNLIKHHVIFSIFFAGFLSFWIYLLHTHTILPGAEGALYTGQCTYGDMNMHLGFITSVAEQAAFPPDYSILSGVKLSYPFLSDSVSSGLLVLGTSLRLSYIFPMIFAMAQLFCTVYLFARTLLSKKTGALLTLLLFFCNGGFGFAYFINTIGENGYKFSDIFTGFYTTPTNLVGENIRWVNLVADMLLPQRATLFGYAVLFPALFLLYHAVFSERRSYFLPAALLLSALPMIHTHSFLSACIISGTWLLLWLRRRLNTELRPGGFWKRLPFICFLVMCAFLCIIQAIHKQTPLSSNALMSMGISVFITTVIYGIFLLFRVIRRHGYKDLFLTWGIFFGCLLLLALPQLLFWTFQQVAEGGFLRGHFNWGNRGDFYPIFYVKNLGIILLPIIGGICACSRKTSPLYLPAFFLWWISEFIVFTPNTYDNNKILYVAYFLLCLAAADYCIELHQRLDKVPGKGMITAVFLFCASFSGVLTLGREAVSRYCLFSTEQTALANYISENTPADAVFLTNDRHNNEIAALTGRDIVCGSDTFLYYHGFNTSARKEDVRKMYEAPLENAELFAQYHVSHIVLSSYEYNDYTIDRAVFAENFTEVFSFGDTVLYSLN